MIEPFEKPVYVTRPFLPPLESYAAGLKEIWDRAWITNQGPVLKRFEAALADRLGTSNLSLFVNGTQALQLGLEALNIRGEVITTPFTFVATTHSLHRQGVTPVFVDIQPDDYNLDPDQVEAAITSDTSAILAVHVFGHPCRHEELAAIAARHGLRLIYDAAHAFGVTVDGRPLVTFGDLSMVSFHATKVFHSIEGGLLTFGDESLRGVFAQLKDFGFSEDDGVDRPGTNAKMNEFQALMGLQLLDHFEQIVARRRAVDACYREELNGVAGLRLPPMPPETVRPNHAYFPIQIDPADHGVSRDELHDALKKWNVFGRPYFHPIIPDLKAYQHLERRHSTEIARSVSERIFALPIHAALEIEDARRIAGMIRRTLKQD